MKRRFSICLLVLALAIAYTIPAGASDASRNPTVVQLACNAVSDSREKVYDVKDVSGEILEAEVVDGGINVIVDVNYKTRIRGNTADEAPYIQGILAAIDDLTNEEDIEKATAYLNIWRAEISAEHIGKDIEKNAKISVFIPTDNNLGMINTRSLSAVEALPTENAQIFYRQLTSFSGSGASVYTDVPMENFDLPSNDEVRNNAYNAVFDIIQNTETEIHEERAKELDRLAVQDYVQDPDNFPKGRKSNGEFYPYDPNSDCANFVSQSYHRGGLEVIDDIWDIGSGVWMHTGGYRGTYQDGGVCDYMEDNGIVFQVGSDWTRAFAGSIIYYSETANPSSAHVGVIASNDGQDVTYSAHTNDHCNEEMNMWLRQNCSYYVPCWDERTQSWTPQ